MFAILKAALAATCLSAVVIGSVSAAELQPFADTSRLVSIGGSLTEIIYALGEEGKLVARDQTALYPEAALKLPDVGYMRTLAPEGVLSVKPTALLVIEGSGPPDALDVLSHAGVQYETVPEAYSAAGVIAKIKAVGEALGVTDKADVLEASLQTALDAVKTRADGVTARKTVMFVLSAQGGKIQASGVGTAADGMIALAGADNAITDYHGYKALTEEAIIAANPDVILMMDRGGDHGATDAELVGNPAIALTTAGKNRAIIRLEGSYLLGFGPRTANAANALMDLLYGKN